MAINDIRLSVIAQPASLARRGWLAELPAQPGPAAIGLVWPAAPAPEAVAAMAGAVLLDSRTGYLDPHPALLPWHSVAANLVLGTGLDPAAPLAGRMLAAMGLAPPWLRGGPRRWRPSSGWCWAWGGRCCTTPGCWSWPGWPGIPPPRASFGPWPGSRPNWAS